MSAARARAIASTAAATISVRKYSRRAVKIGAPSPCGTTYAAIVAIEIVETVATRSPATIAGSASGSSTRRSTCASVRPIARAASSTSGGAARSPASTLRKRTRSVYETSAIWTVSTPMPVIGTSRRKSAMLGIVYTPAATAASGRSSQPCLWARSAAAKAIAKPTPTAVAVRRTCSSSAGWSTEPQFSRTQSAQKKRFSTTHSLAAPNSGMTGSPLNAAAPRAARA